VSGDRAASLVVSVIAPIYILFSIVVHLVSGLLHNSLNHGVLDVLVAQNILQVQVLTLVVRAHAVLVALVL
jgi:uncharacterized membrane protein YedE/YeeE